MTFTLASTAPRPQRVLVDVAVHFVKAQARTGRKIFKIARLDLAPGARAELKATISLAVHTTRIPRPGPHAVDVLLNGVAIRAGSFVVLPVRRG